MKAKSAYSVKKWEESTYSQITPEMKMTKATVVFALQGDLKGQAEVEYLMFYRYFNAEDQHKSSASYVALMRIVADVKGKEGSFAVEDRGTFERGAASSTLKPGRTGLN